MNVRYVLEGGLDTSARVGGASEGEEVITEAVVTDDALAVGASAE
jgi:hypothetical protein